MLSSNTGQLSSVDHAGCLTFMVPPETFQSREEDRHMSEDTKFWMMDAVMDGNRANSTVRRM